MKKAWSNESNPKTVETIAESHHEGISKAERILYLWNLLYAGGTGDGVTLNRIIDQYAEIRASHGDQPIKEKSMRRVVMRDIEFIKSIGMDVRTTSTRPKRYHLGLVSLPKLTGPNAASAYASMLLHRGTLMEDAVSEAQRYVGNSLKIAISPECLEKRIAVIGDTMAEPEAYGGFLGKLLRGIIEEFVLRVAYLNNLGEKKDHQVEPLGLVCKRGVWYLIGISLKSGYTVTLRVDQMDSVFVTSEKYKYPNDFSLADYVRSGWGIVCDEETEKVELKFSPRVASRVKKITYHPSQRVIRELKDGSIVLGFDVCGLFEMESWILGWGTEVEVITPEWLRKHIMKQAGDIVRLYG